ncbi:MAG: hypothetical protein ABSF37_01960 [Sedimentisphaerales bacterium]|jgi:hypothetical protein
MAPEAIDNTWLPTIESELHTEDSDVTIRDYLEIPQKDIPQYKYRSIWNSRERFMWKLPIIKRVSSVEEKVELEEEFLAAQTSYVSIFIGKETDYRSWIINPTGVINGYIPEPKIDILVRVAPDVIKKSKANGWWDELNTAIVLAKTTYTTLKKIELLLEKDPEIPGRETLRFIFTVSGNPEQILEEESKFKKHIRSKIRQHTRENITVTYYWK